HEPAGLAEEGIDLALAGHFLAIVLCKVRFVVEGIDMADAAGTENLNDTFGLGGEVRRLRRVRRRWRFCPRLLLEHPGQRDAAEPAARLPEKATARDRQPI